MSERAWAVVAEELKREPYKVKVNLWNGGAAIDVTLYFRSKGRLDQSVRLRGSEGISYGGELGIDKPFRELRVEPKARSCSVQVSFSKRSSSGTSLAWGAVRSFLESHLHPSACIEAERGYSTWKVKEALDRLVYIEKDLRELEEALCQAT